MKAESRNDDEELADRVSRAGSGDWAALDEVLYAVKDDVYRLALRMTAHPQDAEDATQEVLIKVLTRLDGFRGESSVRTWVYRIAVHHLLDRKKSRVELLALDFERYGADLLDGLAADPDPDPVMAREVMLGCTLAMLTCLDRDHRIAYVLADVFDLSHGEAASLCEVTEDAFRQRLSRARRALEAFTRRYCGLVSRDGPCSCPRRVNRAESLGRVRRGVPQLAAGLEAATAEMLALHTTASLLRSHPPYRAPDGLRCTVDALLDRAPTLLGHG